MKNGIAFVVAAIVTAILYWFTKRYTKFVQTDFNTLAYVDPTSVPGATPRVDGQTQQTVDQKTIGTYLDVRLPEAQISSSFGDIFSPNPLNPMVPPMDYGNQFLDTPNLVYNQATSPAMGPVS